MNLKDFLAENNFLIDEQIAELLSTVLNQNRKAILLRGPAGVGKTQLTTLIAKYLNAEYIFYQCTYGTAEDDLLYKYVPSENTKSGIRIMLGPVPYALKLSNSKKVVLVIDEFDKTRPSADALLLDVLQNYRISLFLDEQETIITGNSANLIIFLTSNDAREFSEPLLRRLVSISLPLLSVNQVYRLLLNKFGDEKLALLLSQVYEDTVLAGLRKPATIQELIQLGEVINSNPNLPLELLIRTIVIKYEDDYQKYIKYIKSRKPYQFIASKQDSNNNNINEFYKPKEEIKTDSINQQNTVQNTSTVSEILNQLKVKQPSKTLEISEEIKEHELYFKAQHNPEKPTVYTNIVKKLMPVPSDTGDALGDFVIKSYSGMPVITSKRPLKIKEILALQKWRDETEIEAYVEDTVKLTNEDIKMLISDSDFVHYYSNKIIRLQKTKKINDGSTEYYCKELVELETDENWYTAENNKPLTVKVRAYVKIFGEEPSLLDKIKFYSNYRD